MRILHVIDPSTPGGGACTLRLLADVAAHLDAATHDVLILGTAQHVRLARRCGLNPVGHLSSVQSLPFSGRVGLRRLLRTTVPMRGRYDLLHAWTVPAATVCTLAAPDRPRLATISVGPLSGFRSHLGLTLLTQQPMPLLVSSPVVRRELRSMGLTGSSITVQSPAVGPDQVEPWSREAVRERWEVGADEFIIGLLSEPADWADAQVASVIATRLVASGREVRLLAHPVAARRAAAERWARQFGRSDLFIVDDEAAEPWRVVSGLDAALLIGGDLNAPDLDDAGSPFSMLTGGGRRLRPQPGVMPLLWAMAAGVPVIAEQSDATSEIVETGERGLLVRPRDVNGACDRIARVFDDRPFADRLGAAARRRVEERHEPAAYGRRLADIYDLVRTGRPIEVESPKREAVAGLAV
ncbi:MAG: glycosyltransferase [Planctomycetota bacterium]